LIRLVRVIEDFLAIIQWVEQVLVHLGHVKSLPKIGNTFLIVSNIFKSEEWVIAFCLYCDETLLDDILTVVLVLSHDALLHIFIHSLTSNADKVDIKIKSQLRLEGDADGLFRFSIDDTLWSIEVEILIQNLGQGA